MPSYSQHAAQLAERLIEAMEAGTAPWQQPWEERPAALPHNPTTGTRYSGANILTLMLARQSDPRWCTYRQAQQNGWQVRRGEKGTVLQHWRWTKKETEKDPQTGEEKTVARRLEKPLLSTFRVFNLSQMEGAPELPEPATPEWSPSEKAEEILGELDISLEHIEGNDAYYSPSNDSIRMPAKDQFASAEDYYGTLLHEVAHWTGGPDRLARIENKSYREAPEEYAREEIRAEISMLLTSSALGIPQKQSSSASYVAHYAKVLRQDPLEVFRAARDADEASTYVVDPASREKLTERAQGRAIRASSLASASSTEASAPRNTMSIKDNPLFLAIPFEEKEGAKIKARKAGLPLRYATPDQGGTKVWTTTDTPEARKVFDEWVPPSQTLVKPDLAKSFSEALKEAGFELPPGFLPAMDGKKNYVRVQGDARGEKRGTYIGGSTQSGIPCGSWYNHREGTRGDWISSADRLTASERSIIKAQAAQQTLQAYRERDTVIAKASAKAVSTLSLAVPATEEHPYLQEKDVAAHGLKLDAARNTLLIPALNKEGAVSTYQYITDTGKKGFMAGGQLSGSSYMIGEPRNGMPVFVAEGYATAATVHEATGAPVAVAFIGANLENVARSMREACPKSPIVIAGDNDRNTERNTGVRDAQRAAKAVEGVAVFPNFDKVRATTYSHWRSELGAASLMAETPVQHLAVVASYAAELIDTPSRVDEPSSEWADNSERGALGARRALTQATSSKSTEKASPEAMESAEKLVQSFERFASGEGSRFAVVRDFKKLESTLPAGSVSTFRHSKALTDFNDMAKWGGPSEVAQQLSNSASAYRAQDSATPSR